MNRNQAPRIARWLLRHFTSGPNIEAIIGDLDERYGQGRSHVWYWEQVVVAIAVSTFKDIRSHKLLALRSLIVGWPVFWFLFGGLNMLINSLLFGGLGKLINYGGKFLSPLNMALSRVFPSIPWARGPLYCFDAFVILGACIIGVVSGWTVGRLHRRRAAMVMPHAFSILVYWIVQGLAIGPASVGLYPPYFWMNIALLTFGILLGGVLCASRLDTGVQRSISV